MNLSQQPMKNKLKIATVVTGHFTTPPPKGIVYAPMDVAVDVGEGLAKKGHWVDFYAPEGSRVNVTRVIGDNLKPLKQNGSHPVLQGPNVDNAEQHKIFNLWDQYLLAQMFKEAEKGDYDILHIHPIDRALPLALSHPKIPVVYTLHDPIYPWRAEIFKMFASPNQFYVSISDNQRLPAPHLNYVRTVYNGVRLDEFPFSDKHDGYLLFVGRLHPEKGVAEAVEAALKADERLIIVGPPVTGEYWDTKVKPFIGGKIEYVGYVPREELFEYYQKAKAVLVPIMWEEPFGLIMTEAMACGAPIVAFRRGSVPEIIEDGRNGFIVNNVEEMAEAIKKVDAISRKECRRTVEEKFAIEKMVEGYEAAFETIINSFKK